MKQETFEKAKELKQQIYHICDVIEIIKTENLTLNPPIRNTSFHIGNSRNDIILNENELLVLKQAFEKEKERLEQEFAVL